MDNTVALHSTFTCTIKLIALSEVLMMTQPIQWSCRLVILGDCYAGNCVNAEHSGAATIMLFPGLLKKKYCILFLDNLGLNQLSECL